MGFRATPPPLANQFSSRPIVTMDVCLKKRSCALGICWEKRAKFQMRSGSFCTSNKGVVEGKEI